MARIHGTCAATTTAAARVEDWPWTSSSSEALDYYSYSPSSLHSALRERTRPLHQPLTTTSTTTTPTYGNEHTTTYPWEHEPTTPSEEEGNQEWEYSYRVVSPMDATRYTSTETRSGYDNNDSEDARIMRPTVNTLGAEIFLQAQGNAHGAGLDVWPPLGNWWDDDNEADDYDNESDVLDD